MWYGPKSSFLHLHLLWWVVHVVALTLKCFKHSGGIPRNACVACENSYAWQPRKCDYWTDTQTPDKAIPTCAAMLRRRPKKEEMKKYLEYFWIITCWLVCLFWGFTSLWQCDLEAGDIQSLKYKRRDRGSNLGPLAPQTKSLATRTPPLPR